MTHPSPKRNMVPKAVLMRSGVVSLTTARPVNTAQPKLTVNSARPMTNIFNKAHSTVRRPINNKTTIKNSNFNHRVNTVSGKNVNTARPKAVVNTARPKAVLNDVKGNQGNAIKASTYWVWKPKTNVLDHGNPQMDLQDQGVIDNRCSRHMTGNMSYLTDFEEIDRGYVAFGGNPKGGLTCLFVKATSDESKLWHLWLGQINFKTMNKLVKGNFVRGLPSNLFENDQTCVACQKRKQHRASFVTDDYSRFSWIFFLATKDETSGILKSFITGVENLIDQWVKVIRCDNGTEFKNKEMNQFCERKGTGPNWLFDIDALTKSMNYKPVIAGNQPNGNVGTKACDDASKARMEIVPGKDYILLPLWPDDPSFSQNSKSSPGAGFKPLGDNEKKVTEEPRKEGGDSSNDQEKEDDNVNNTNNVNTASDGNNTNNVNAVSSTVNAAGIEVNVVGAKTSIELPNDPNMPELEEIVYSDDDENVGVEADMNNLNTFIPVSPIPTTRIHKDHPVKQIIKDLNSTPQTRRMIKNLKEHGTRRLVAQGYTQEEGIDYDEVFAPVARIEELMKSFAPVPELEEISLFPAYASFKDLWCTRWMTIVLILSFTDVKIASTPMETQKPLLKDEDGEEVDVYLYRSMIGLLTHLTSSRPDITFAVCACARYQVNPKVSHLHVVKRIFRYLKGQPKLGLWYPKDSPFDLVAYTDSDYAGASLDRKYTTGEAEYVTALSCCGQVIWIQNQLLDYGDSNEKKLIQMVKIHTDKNVADLITKAFDKGIGVNADDSKLMPLGINLPLLGKVNAARHNLLLLVVKTVNGEVQLQALVDGKKIIVTEASVRRDLQLDDEEGMDCLPNATIFKEITKIGMVKNLENVSGKFLMYPKFVKVFLNKQIEGMSSHKRIYVTPSHTKKIFRNMKRVGKGFSGNVTPLFPTMVVQAQEEMGEGSEMPTDPHHTPIITQPSSSQPQKKQKSRRPKKKDTQISQPSDPTNVADGAVNEEPSMQLKELMEFCTKLQQRVFDLENTKTAQAQEITSLKLRVKKLEKKGRSRTHKLKRLYKVSRSARVVSSEEVSLGDQEDAFKQGRKIDDIDKDAEITLVDETQWRYGDEDMFGVNDLDGDEVVVESEVTDKAGEKRNTVEEAVAMTDAVTIPVSAATITNVELNLAQTLEELKSARPRQKELLCKSQVNQLQQYLYNYHHRLRVKAQRIRAQEKQELTIEEKSTLFVQLLEKRNKHFVAKRAEELRNRPPTRAQQRSIMCTYLKNMAGWKPKDLKNKSFANIQELFDKAMKKVNTFVDMDTELVEGSEKVDEDKETAELQSLMEVILDEEEVAVDATLLATKPPSILLMKKLEILKENIKFRGGLLGFKRLHDDLKVTAAKVCVTAAKLKLVLFINSNEKYAK
ncbi:putative ribonuclease H-like domain-containing protein [Tanacetum coccineum]